MFLGLLATLVLTASAQAASPATTGQDANCLECHVDKTLKSEAGRSVFVDTLHLKSGVHGKLHCQSCHTGIKDLPHASKVAHVACTSCHAQPSGDVRSSAHGAQGPQACAGCHGTAHDVRPTGEMGLQQCAGCHEKVVQQYRASLHGANRRNGVADSPTCKSCHGTVHKVVPHTDPASPVSKENLAGTCGSCHANPKFLEHHDIPFVRPVEAYRLSVHGRAVARGNANAPTCSDCHTSHAIYPATDARSSLYHPRVAATCGRCHTKISQIFAQSVHGRAVQRGAAGAPECTDCHGEHAILAPSEANSLVNPARVSTVTCGRCHADERLARRYNLPMDKVPAYQDSYHGLAKRAGSKTVANCASCHGVHNILPSSDPGSTINAANLGHTCGACHPGAGARFAISKVHVSPGGAGEPHHVVKWIRMAYLVLIPVTIGFMALYVILDFFSKLLKSRPHLKEAAAGAYRRMNLHFRIEHWLVMVSFPTLVITGFALKYPESWWAQPMLRWEGTFPFRGTVHRVAAAIMVGALVYHLVHLMASRRDRIVIREMMPGIKDGTDFFGMVRYNLGFRGERPRYGMFSFAEKAEYLAFLWGSVVMAVTGLVLWFNSWALQYLPKWVSDAATALHFYEAILATLAILIWHMYMVIFDPDVYPMDKAWLTGNAPAEHLEHTRNRRYLRFLRRARQEEK